ncbi:MAG: ATP phosphoribosyltransferase regulatory subunit [Deltaproteobacteria bacterium]|nr:ATP phosphoribosyltransferase regulatory subunit [Deltaproteobacteria bacterium]
MVEPLSLRLPAGIRDFAPGAAAARRQIAETLIGVFERWGYAQVITPAFEYEAVLALGLGSDGRASALRFVEPSSGQVLALRPDITPQIARLMATRFRDEVGPIRMCYEGPVFRYDAAARAQRELIQAGVELAGVQGADGDVEVIGTALDALTAAGLPEVTIDLAHPGLARSVIEAARLPEPLVPVFRQRLAKRDRAGVAELLTQASGPKAMLAFAALLPAFSGGPAILENAAASAPSPDVRNALADLREVVDRLLKRGVAKSRLHVDLGEVRGFDYYTGVRFQGFVHGAADAIVAGGRYDALMGRYGRPRPAVGFAIDVELTAGALEEQHGGLPVGPRNGQGGVLVVGEPAAAEAQAHKLRDAGTRAAVAGPMDSEDARAYARRWGYSEVLLAGKKTKTLSVE